MSEIPELFDVVDNLRNDVHEVWRRIKALNGDQFALRFCCNSERVQRILIEQEGRAVMMTHMEQAEKMPHECVAIIARCKEDSHLKRVVRAFSRSKLDIIFECGGFDLLGWRVKEVS